MGKACNLVRASSSQARRSSVDGTGMAVATGVCLKRGRRTAGRGGQPTRLFCALVALVSAAAIGGRDPPAWLFGTWSNFGPLGAFAQSDPKPWQPLPNRPDLPNGSSLLTPYRVVPAFQWTQNDSAVFVMVKFTRRWDSPLNVNAFVPDVNITEDVFNVTGEQYYLTAPIFDFLDAERSSWKRAGLGKVSLVLAKRYARRWPRLLADWKIEHTNMGVWKEMEKKVAKELTLEIGVESRLSCATQSKLFCVTTDECRRPEQCHKCPGKPKPTPETSLCEGVPRSNAKVGFHDGDPETDVVGGDIHMLKAPYEDDLDTYVLYWGQSKTHPVKDLPEMKAKIGEVPATGEKMLKLTLPMGSKFPPETTHLLVFGRNQHGEVEEPFAAPFRDGKRPVGLVENMTLADQSNSPSGTLTGMMTFELPKDIKITKDKHKWEYYDAKYKEDFYAIYWGQNATHKHAKAKPVAPEVQPSRNQQEGETFVLPIIRHTLNPPKGQSGTHGDPRKQGPPLKIPKGATHLLVFTKNIFGEMKEGTSVPIWQKSPTKKPEKPPEAPPQAPDDGKTAEL